MRGSILDVFSFSYEFPYRIDFFGNEVETIRSFDVETQLSKEKLDSIYIVPEMTKGNRTNSSLLDSLPSETLLASKDMAWVKERIGSIWNEEPIIGDEESFANIEQLRAKLITGEDFSTCGTWFLPAPFWYAAYGSSRCHPDFLNGSTTDLS